MHPYKQSTSQLWRLGYHRGVGRRMLGHGDAPPLKDMTYIPATHWFSLRTNSSTPHRVYIFKPGRKKLVATQTAEGVHTQLAKEAKV